MKRRRIGCLIGFGGALLLGGAFGWWFFFSKYMAIDRCLDGGGRWADGGYCEDARAGE